jgi:nicotinamidase-related amidase
MPLSQLDPHVALIVIDLQKGIVAIPTATPSSEIVTKAAELAEAFRKRNLPVVLVNVVAPAPGRTDAPRPNFAFPDDWTDLVPELNPQPTDILISKRSRGAFITTDLHAQLQSQNVTQVFLAGIATSAGVEATACSAHDHGYNVVFVTDAMTDRSPEAHAYRIETAFPRIGETETTTNVLKALQL